MRLSVFTPVKNEAEYIGYSIMAAAPYAHEFLYGVSPSNDGTMDILKDIKGKHLGSMLQIFEMDDFDVRDQKAYEGAYNFLIQKATGDALWYLHPDMIVASALAMESTIMRDSYKPGGHLAWSCKIRSFAGDRTTEIVEGRAKTWKTIHARKFGLHYAGAYGSQNEDMYFRDITGNSYKHYDEDFSKYPFEIQWSGLRINHYCEAKTYARRLEKMKLCIQQQHPGWTPRLVEEVAMIHPRVTLESGSSQFGHYEFEERPESLPAVFKQYDFKGELVHG